MTKHIPDIERALTAVGELLAADEATAAVVIFQDLLALRPTAAELDAAAGWVRTQDPSPEFATALDKVVGHVRAR